MDDLEVAFFAALMAGHDLPDGVEVVDRPDWHQQAACRAPGVDPRWFFPDRGQPTEPAKAVCRNCPVLDSCDAYADTFSPSQLFGIWAGGSARSRKRRRLPDAA